LHLLGRVEANLRSPKLRASTQPRAFKRRQRVGTLRIGAHVTAALKENRGEQGNNAPKRNPFDTENCES
jgi:hypothetical protein